MHGVNKAIERWAGKPTLLKRSEMTVVIGRFQTPYLHEAHKVLLDEALKKAHRTMLILKDTLWEDVVRRARVL